MKIEKRIHFALDEGGAGGETGGQGAASGAEGQAAQGQKPAPKYTDDDVNAMIAKGKAEAVAGLLKEHGIESTGALKTDLKALKDFRAANQTEAERLAAQVKESGDKISAAEARAIAAELRAEGFAAGIDPKKMERALRLAATSEGETAAEKVASLLKDFPEFKATGAGGQDFGGKAKDQGGNKAATMTAQLEEAMGLKKKP